MIRFTTDEITVKAEEGESLRQIDAIAVPYNTFATVSDGTEVSFMPGSLKFDRAPRVFMFHDSTKVVGVVAETVDTPEAMLASLKLARTSMADDALELAGMGAFAVSVGVNPIKSTIDAQGRVIVSEAQWEEISLVPTPAFSGAQITQVLASADDSVLSSDEEPDTETTTEQVEETETVEAEKTETVVAASVTPTPLYATPTRQFRLPSPAEYIASMVRGGSEFAQLNANIKAAAGDIETGDTPGLLPTSVVAPIFDDINPLRPLVSALGTRSMPQAGKVFIRPVITTHTEVDEQSSELSGLASRTMVVDDLQITKATYGGTVLLSEQTIDWSDPSMLSAVINDLAGQYALATELAAVTEVVAELPSGNRIVVTDPTDAEEVVGDLYDAAANIGTIGNYLPTHLLVSPSGWARLAKLVDGDNRPLFPQLGPMNAAGTMSGAVAYNGNPLGLQLIVSNQVTDQAVGNQDAEDFAFIFNARSIECYEQTKGLISLDNVGVLGRQVSFRGYFAPKVIQPAGLYGIGPAQTPPPE
jgi:HK97 family phage prohead protease/HK97 family phage major capsid protein